MALFVSLKRFCCSIHIYHFVCQRSSSPTSLFSFQTFQVYFFRVWDMNVQAFYRTVCNFGERKLTKTQTHKGDICLCRLLLLWIKSMSYSLFLYSTTDRMKYCLCNLCKEQGFSISCVCYWIWHAYFSLPIPQWYHGINMKPYSISLIPSLASTIHEFQNSQGEGMQSELHL